LTEFGPLVLEKKIFFLIFSVFLLFCFYLPLDMGYPLHLKLITPSLNDDLCQVWLKLAKWFWSRRFLNNPPHFCIFVIISPLKKAWPFIWTNLNSLHPRMVYFKSDWIWPAGSGKDFLMTLSHFYIFMIIYPFMRNWPFIWKKLEFPSPKDNACKVWLNLACWFWRRFFKNFRCIFTLSLLSQLG
jgi:hypothetical protein